MTWLRSASTWRQRARWRIPKTKNEPRPLLTGEALRAGAEAVGVAFTMDEHGIVLDGQRFTSLTEADEHLEARAVRLGHLLALQAVKEEEEARLVICQREARIAITETRAAMAEAPNGDDLLPPALRF